MKKVFEKKIVSIFLTMAMIFSFSVTYVPQLEVNADSGAKSTTQGFYVDGTKIYDANGNEFIMRGTNHGHTWYPSQSRTAIKAIAETGANCIRLVLSDGHATATTPGPATTASEMEKLIQTCIDNKLVPIVEMHNETGGANVKTTLQNAVNYWKQSDIVSVLNKYEKYVIVNIANEWYGLWSNTENWRDAYKAAIPDLRTAGINNMIMVDAPGYGQDTADCIKHCNDVFDSDPNANTVFSYHMYYNAAGTDKKVVDSIDGILAKNVPLVIGEFGYMHSGNAVKYQKIMDYCTEKGVGYLSWIWLENAEEASQTPLNMVEWPSWDGSNLTEWGDNVINGKNGIRETSKLATIFDDSVNDDSNDYSDAQVIAETAIDNFGWNGDNVIPFDLTGYDSAMIVAEGECDYGSMKLSVAIKVSEDENGDAVYKDVTLVEDAQTNAKGIYTYEFSADEIAEFSGECYLYIQGSGGDLDTVKIISANNSSEDSSITESSSEEETSSEADISSEEESSSEADISSNEENSSEAEETVIAETAISDLGWNDNNVLDFNLTGYDSAKIVATGDCAYIKLSVNGETVLVDAAQTDSNGVYTYEFSADELAKYSTDCKLYVQGQDGTLDSVKIIGTKSSQNENDDYVVDTSVVKYQLKNNGDTIRFVMIADENDVLAAKTAEAEVRIIDTNAPDSDPLIFKTNITSTYRSIYAGGKKVTAPDGKLFLISSEVSGVSQSGYKSIGIFGFDTISTRYAGVYQN